MDNSVSKKYKIKIPKNITVFYCSSKNIITILGPTAKKSIKPKLKIEIVDKNNIIFVTNTSIKKLSNSTKKNIKALRGTTIALLKRLIVETSTILYKKLKIVGIGYKAFDVDDFKNKVLLMKLGFSHSIYFKIPENLNIFCLKQTKIFIYGSTYQYISQTAFQIQLLKLPEPYKGKGILYENSKIKLKEGKKT